jgi:hypothetical protein
MVSLCEGSEHVRDDPRMRQRIHNFFAQRPGAGRRGRRRIRTCADSFSPRFLASAARARPSDALRKIARFSSPRICSPRARATPRGSHARRAALAPRPPRTRAVRAPRLPGSRGHSAARLLLKASGALHPSGVRPASRRRRAVSRNRSARSRYHPTRAAARGRATDLCCSRRILERFENAHQEHQDRWL